MSGAPAGWTEVPNVNYTTWFDAEGRAAVEWYHSGRVLVRPDAASLLSISIDRWGVDSARPTWGVRYAATTSPSLCEDCGEEGGNHAADCVTWGDEARGDYEP